MIIVVTNLAANQEKVHNVWEKYYREKPEEYGWVKDALSLVHYVEADALELQNQTVTTSLGQVSLKGHVALIHEQFVLSSHGMLNEKDLPLLGSLLSDEGMIMTKRVGMSFGGVPLDASALPYANYTDLVVNMKPLSTTSVSSASSEAPLSINNYQRKENRAALAVRNMMDKGFKLIECVPIKKDKGIELNYAFFTSPSAPSIHVFNVNTKDYDLSTAKNLSRQTYVFEKAIY